MSVVFVLIGASLLVASGFLAAYLWAVKSGQYDDKHTPAIRILFENNKKENSVENRAMSDENKDEKSEKE
ncbi:MAG: cbb3-type cytochrome oxidase assembly protein CcoS [Melioribacter sp.]|nr:cbb3-type cytochrome oxidase assembly protein CcoS [Melioribacter sp.]